MANYPNSLCTTWDEGSSYQDAVAVTPSDASPITNGFCRGLFVGGAGNLTIITPAGTTTTLIIPAGACGFTIPINAAYVKATGTTATGIVALY